MKLSYFLASVFLPLTLSSAPSYANTLSDFYIGAGFGINNYEHIATTDDDPYAWDFFAGYMFNDYFAAEVGFRDLGKAEWIFDGIENDASVKGATLGLVGVMPLTNQWSITAETGLMYYTFDNTQRSGLLADAYSASDFAPYFGMGVGYNFTENLKLQAKYRRYENLDDTEFNTYQLDSNYWGLELSYRFGSSGSTQPAQNSSPAYNKVDADNDGINDDIDQCPDTDPAHKVDQIGCTVYEQVKKQENVGSIQFDNNSAVVKKVYFKDIERLANYLKKNENFTVEIGGHASNVGNASQNLTLSQNRANAVAQILVKHFGIDQTRVSAKGYGVTKPLVAGNSQEAHAVNRRIEAIVTTQEKIPVLK